jgi:hypothetical protein
MLLVGRTQSLLLDGIFIIGASSVRSFNARILRLCPSSSQMSVFASKVSVAGFWTFLNQVVSGRLPLLCRRKALAGPAASPSLIYGTDNMNEKETRQICLMQPVSSHVATDIYIENGQSIFDTSGFEPSILCLLVTVARTGMLGSAALDRRRDVKLT